MEEKVYKDTLLIDPLSGITRRKRSLLLGVSVLSIVMVKTGLVPAKISALGIEFTNTDQRSILWITAIITIYFLCAFSIYAASDFLAWKKVIRTESVKHAKEQLKEAQISDPRYYEEQDYIERNVPSARILFRFQSPISILRAIFDFVLPFVIGIYAILLLLFHRIQAT